VVMKWGCITVQVWKRPSFTATSKARRVRAPALAQCGARQWRYRVSVFHSCAGQELTHLGERIPSVGSIWDVC
jgi:hypothetical protein